MYIWLKWESSPASIMRNLLGEGKHICLVSLFAEMDLEREREVSGNQDTKHFLSQEKSSE